MSEKSYLDEFFKKPMTYDELWHDSWERALSLPVGTKFTTLDLYTGIYWNTLPRGYRTAVCNFFKTRVLITDGKDIKHIGMKQGLQLYERV